MENFHNKKREASTKTHFRVNSPNKVEPGLVFPLTLTYALVPLTYLLWSAPAVIH